VETPAALFAELRARRPIFVTPGPASLLAGVLACQSATSWAQARSACSARAFSRARTSLSEEPTAGPFCPRPEAFRP